LPRKEQSLPKQVTFDSKVNHSMISKLQREQKEKQIELKRLMHLKDKQWKKRYNGLKKMTHLYKNKASTYEQTLVQMIDRVSLVEQKNKHMTKMARREVKEQAVQDRFLDLERDQSDKRIVNLTLDKKSRTTRRTGCSDKLSHQEQLLPTGPLLDTSIPQSDLSTLTQHAPLLIRQHSKSPAKLSMKDASVQLTTQNDYKQS